MKCNMGSLDRISRLFAGIALVAIGIGGDYNPVLLGLGGIAALTGALGFCPAYVLFGFDSLEETTAKAA